MKRRVIGVALVCVILGYVAGAAAQESGRYVWGTGTNSCGTWLEGRTAWRTYIATKPAPPVTADVALAAARSQWVLGFVTGAGWDTSEGIQMRRVDNDGIWVAMDRACASDPTVQILEAAKTVAIALIARP